MSVSLTALASPIIGKVFSELYAAGKAGFEKHLSVIATKRASETLYKKIANVEKVKTIWQIDKPINLRRFYYPSKVVLDGKILTVENLGDLKTKESLVFQGTIGQGKSTFLRYVCIKELEKGERFPLFVELRRIQKDSSLLEMLKANLVLLGFKDVSNDLFRFLAESGKLTILLDAFDELPPEKINSVLNEIENLIDSFPDTQVVVTSRPNSGIEKSPRLRVIQIAPLLPTDFEGFLKKIQPNKTERQSLLTAITESTTEISALITTPLMLTLLVLAYRNNSVIPRDMSEFYESLFSTLISRHDKSKPGYMRHRYSDLGDKELQILFEGFCFISRSKSLGVIDSDNLYEITKLASQYTNIVCTDEQFKNEMTKVACLMIEEASKLYFIHKSVQEYYTAMYVKRSSESFAISFYQKIMNRGQQDWEQELIFLKQIDQHRYSKHFFVPAFESFIALVGLNTDDKKVVIDDEVLRKIGTPFIVEFVQPSPGGTEAATPAAVSWPAQVGSYFLSMTLSRFSSTVLGILQEVVNSAHGVETRSLFSYAELDKLSAMDESDEETPWTFSFLTLSEKTILLDKMRTSMADFLQKLYDEYLQRKVYIEKEESKASQLIDLLP